MKFVAQIYVQTFFDAAGGGVTFMCRTSAKRELIFLMQ